ASNYNISYAPGSLTVHPAPLRITADDQTKTYGNAFTFAGIAISTNGLVNGDTVTSVTLTSSGAAATADMTGAPYPITPSRAMGPRLSNYAITYASGSLTVHPAPLTITANDATVATGQPNPPFSVQYGGFVLGQDPSVLGGSLTFDVPAGASNQ